VKNTSNGFTQGDMFFGTFDKGFIGWASANGISCDNQWKVLTNETTEALFRGGFYVDQSGSFGGDLIAVTGGGQAEGDFLFPNQVHLAPGTTYYFQPIIQSGGPFSASGDTFRYPGGSAFLNGNAVSEDLWFREGIIVPEPSAAALALIGFGTFLYARRGDKNKKKRLLSQSHNVFSYFENHSRK
jgi:hypothetical protein